MQLDTSTLTFILALGSFVLVALATVINARQARLEREEARRREEDQRREVRRREELARLTDNLKTLIKLYGQNSGTTVIRDIDQTNAEMLGIMLSLHDETMRDLAEKFTGRDSMTILRQAIIRMGDLIDDVMKRN